MSLYIPFIHKIIKKEDKQTQIRLYIENPEKISEKKNKENYNIIIIELF